MSFLIGPVSGALVAGGVYYGFSNLIQERTKKLSTDLHIQSMRLIETPSLVQAPPSAASRITQKPFLNLVHTRWNQQVEGLFRWCQNADRRILHWRRNSVDGLPEDKQSH